MDLPSGELESRLKGVADPVGLLAGIFAHAPFGLQIYTADGHSLLTNQAFRDMFGSEPPPEYCVFDDDQLRATGMQGLVRRAFAGETVRTPTVWYDPREQNVVPMTQGKRAALQATFFPLRNAEGAVSHVAIAYRDLTAEMQAQQRVEAERDKLRAVVEQTGDGIVVADEHGAVQIFNLAAQRQHGVHSQPVTPADWASTFGLRRADGGALPLDETPLYRALRGEHITGARWMVERPDGQRRMLTGTATPLRRPDGTNGGAVLVTRDETERLALEAELRSQRVSAERAAARASRLLQVAAVLSRTAQVGDVARVTLEQAMALIGAHGGMVVHLVGDKLERLASQGFSPVDFSAWTSIPSGSDVPVAVALRRGEPIWVESLAQDERFPAFRASMAARPAMLGARAAIPLQIAGRAVGALGLRFEGTHVWDPEERAWLIALARLCAQALERARLSSQAEQERLLHEQELRARAEEDATRARFLAAASGALSESLDVTATMERIARLAVPKLGDLCVVDLLLETGGVVRGAVAHRDPAVQQTLEKAREAFPPTLTSKHISAQVLRSGEPVLVPVLTPELLRSVTHGEAHEAAIRDLGVHSVMGLPLVVRGRVFGALNLWRIGDSPGYTESNLALATELAQRAAVAADNARLYGEAQAAIALREEFLSVAGHEIKTPLTALKLQLDGLRRLCKVQAAVDSGQLAPRVAVAARQTERLASLTNQLLDVSRVRAGKMHLSLERLDYSAVLREVAGRFNDEVSRGSSELEVSVPAELFGVADRGRVEQIATNLLANAFKYGDGKPVTLTLAKEGESARITVQDRGIGISPQDQARIFERFERAVSAKNYGGIGLGLWIVRQVVQALGGSVAVTSARGEGSVFTVDLPLGGPRSAAQEQQGTREEGAPAPLEGEQSRPAPSVPAPSV